MDSTTRTTTSTTPTTRAMPSLAIYVRGPPPPKRLTWTTPEEEALQRNRWMIATYGPVPSYGLWNAHSVGSDTVEWVDWWRGVLQRPVYPPLPKNTMYLQKKRTQCV